MLQMSSVLKQHRNSRTLVYKHCGRFWRSASQNMRVCVNWILMNTAHCFWSKTQYGWWTQSCTWNSSCHGIFSTLFPGISCNLPEQSPTSRPSSYRDPILVILEGDRSAPQKHGLKARFHVIVGFDEHGITDQKGQGLYCHNFVSMDRPSSCCQASSKRRTQWYAWPVAGIVVFKWWEMPKRSHGSETIPEVSKKFLDWAWITMPMGKQTHFYHCKVHCAMALPLQNWLLRRKKSGVKIWSFVKSLRFGTLCS